MKKKRYRPGDNRLNWKTILVAVLVSLLVHQALFFGLNYLGLFQSVTKEEKTEITYLEPPPPPEEKKPEPEKKPEVAAPPAPMPLPAPRPRPVPAPSKPEPPPQEPPAAQSESIPTPEPMGPPSPEPPATDPNPKPPQPATLTTKMNWGVFERTMGQVAQEELVKYQEESMRKRGGGSPFGQLSPKVAKALQTHKSWIQGAPREPIDPHAPVFQDYLNSTHDKIHRLFADSFLPSLVSLGASHPLNDFNIMSLVEFEILETGAINEVRLIKTSGQSVFDAAAIDSLYRASPFLPPPKKILSWNNRVYFRWGFYRNQRKCGTFNAQGYILRSPNAPPVPISEELYKGQDVPSPDKFRITDG